MDCQFIYPDFMPTQPSSLPDEGVRSSIAHIIFHVADPTWPGETERPPRRPVKFHQFPNLTHFTVDIPLRVPIQELLRQSADGMIRPSFRLDGGAGDEYFGDLPTWEETEPDAASYRALTPKTKVALWRNRYSARDFLDYAGRVGRGGWLSRLVDTKKYPEPLTLDVDGDGYDDDYDQDFQAQEEGISHDPEVLGQRLAQFRTVAGRLRVMVEIELWATTRDKYYDPAQSIEERPVLLVLDPKRCEIVAMKVLSEKQFENRKDMRREAE